MWGPWLLAAKAAVNLSSTRGQKLLPTCKEAIEEDHESLQELYECEMRRRQAELPVEVNLCEIGKTPGTPVTPPRANRDDDRVVTQSEEVGDDWETFGDYLNGCRFLERLQEMQAKLVMGRCFEACYMKQQVTRKIEGIVILNEIILY